MKEITTRYIFLLVSFFLLFHLSNGQPVTKLNYTETIFIHYISTGFALIYATFMYIIYFS